MAYIWLRNRKGIVVAHVLVDLADFDGVADFGWCLNANGYAWRSSRSEPNESAHVYMHRQLMGLHAGDRRQVDHINRNKLDNRRANLRLADNRTNKHNVPGRDITSRHRGVCFDRERGKWRATVQLEGRGVLVGRYDTEGEAAAAASRYRAEHMPYSEDAGLNR